MKDISIQSNKTFLLEFWEHFFYLYSNKLIKYFQKKNINNLNTNVINNINIDYLYKKNYFNLNNDITYHFPFNQINSDFSLYDKDNDKKKFISDNKILDLSDYNNNNHMLNSDLNVPKANIIQNSSLNNLVLQDSPLFHENNINYKTLASKSFHNMPKISSITNLNSLNNLNNIGYTPPKLTIFDPFYHNYSNNINSINSMTNINAMNNINNLNTMNTLLSPLPAPHNTFHFASIPNTQMLQTVDKNNINGNNNFIFSNGLNINNSLNSENDKNNTTLNVFNKKRKRDIKNNKLVFISQNEKIEKEIKKKENRINTIELASNNNVETSQSNEINSEKDRKPRGSKYRGVSRNGNQWQVLIMVNKKKRYVGSYSREEEAARAYDKVALQNHGVKAKTNFDYTKQQVEEILALPQLLKLY